jgi:hypothetical protein
VDSGDTEFTEEEYREMLENQLESAMNGARESEFDDEGY